MAFSYKLRPLKMALTKEFWIHRKSQEPAASVASIAAAIEEYYPLTTCYLFSATGLSVMKIHCILINELGMVKKELKMDAQIAS